MVDFESLLAKVRWLITELDDVRDTAIRLQRVLELAAEHANGAEKDRTASVAANSTFREPIDTPILVGTSDRHILDTWMERRGSIPLVAQLMSASIEEARGQAGL